MKKSEVLERIREGQKPGGEGSATWAGFKEKRVPSSGEADELASYGIPLDVDPEIRDVVIALNREGYHTHGSCAGHSRSGKWTGYIVFAPNLEKGDKKGISEIVEEYGISSHRFHKKHDWTSLKFPPMGRKANW